MASEKSALKNERLALSALLCSSSEGERKRELEMNGMVMHSKVNENPGSLLLCPKPNARKRRRIRLLKSARTDAIKRNCLLFFIQWEGPWR